MSTSIHQHITTLTHQHINSMTVSHRAADASAASLEAVKPVKVARMACCCKLSDLLPLVQQMHETVRANAAARQRSEAA